MVLCVLNQPKMELGNGGGASQTPNRKRKRKLSAPARRVMQYASEEPKIIKLDEIEASRQNSQMKQISSPLPGKRMKERHMGRAREHTLNTFCYRE